MTPIALFYRPAGTVTELYRTSPEALRMTVYPYRGDLPKRGAVFFIHGGGWRTGGSDLALYRDWERPLARARLQAFSIEHRLAPEYGGEAMVSDCVAAIDFVRERAARFGLPARKVGVVGFSSGGHLGALAALRHPERVAAVAAFYAPMDLEMLWRNGDDEIRGYLRGFAGFDDAVPWGDLAAFSPQRLLRRDGPRFWLLHGEADGLVPASQSVLFLNRARSLASDRVRVTLVPNAGHHFLQSRSAWARRIERDVADFIADSLAGDASP